MIIAAIALAVTISCVAYVFYKIFIKQKFAPCDSCKHLKQKGNVWRYRCMCRDVYPREFQNAPSFCRFYEREIREDENN